MITRNESLAFHKIVILNPKGGSGKTTLATNLASRLAASGAPPTLVDCDPQGYCLRWLERRPATKPLIHGFSAVPVAGDAGGAGRSRAWPESQHLIVDLPAAHEPAQIHDLTYDADSILIPVMPSSIDTYAASRFIAELLLNAQIDRRNRQLAVVANRVRQNTRSYRRLLKFLNSLRIPLIGELRDSQNFVTAAARGLGVGELPQSRAARDSAALQRIVDWIEELPTRRLDAVATVAYEHRPGISVLTPARLLER